MDRTTEEVKEMGHIKHGVGKIESVEQPKGTEAPPDPEWTEEDEQALAEEQEQDS